MKCNAAAGLAVGLMAMACLMTGCPSTQTGTGSIIGRWRIYSYFEGFEETGTGIFNFYMNGSCNTSTLDGGTIPGSWRTRADGTVIADFSASTYTTEGLLRQDYTLNLDVNGDELTGTIRALICVDLDCIEGNGTVEGVRIAKSESLLSETPTSAPHGVMGPLESLVNERFSLVP